MSYNIDSIDYIGDDRLAISGEQFARLALNVPRKDRPAGDFISDLKEDEPSQVLHRISWQGECSGYTFHLFIHALSLTTGKAELVICWEGVDSYTGLRIVDGKVTKHKIVMRLGHEIE